MRRKYEVAFQTFSQDYQFLTHDEFTGDILYYNSGFCPVDINGVVLQPGWSFKINCQQEEADYTKYGIHFLPNPVAPLATKQFQMFIKKYFPMENEAELKKQKYVLSVLTYQTPNSFQPSGENIGDVLFLNSGTNSINLNGFSLQSGGTFGVTANKNEMDITKYTWFWNPFTPGTNSLTIIIKKFVE